MHQADDLMLNNENDLGTKMKELMKGANVGICHGEVEDFYRVIFHVLYFGSLCWNLHTLQVTPNLIKRSIDIQL